MEQRTHKGKCSFEQIKSRLPELLVILFCMLLLGIGVSRKEGFHMDELLSFELSNAEFNPWIVPTQPEGRLAKFVNREIKADTFGETVKNMADTVMDVLKNRGESKLLSYQADVYEEPVWITAEQFHDYITVDEDAFNYLSVYFNVKDDNHPPFHFMLLHTVSSLFRGRAEAWMGCAINMACVAVTMILLMKLGRLIAPAFGWERYGRALGLLAALSYGCSTGAMATTLLIRMYGLLTCFCVALLFFHVKKWLSGGFGSHNKGLIAVTVLGFLTQYFFLFYCLILAAVTAVLLWCRKRNRELLVYVRSMIVAGVIGVGIFPFAVADVFSSGRGVEALDNLASGLNGMWLRLQSFAGILADRTFSGVLFVILAVLAVVLWGLSVRKGDRTAAGLGKRTVSALLFVPVLGYFLLAARMSPYLVDRYIMPLFPFIAFFGALVLVGVAAFLERNGKSSRSFYITCGVVVVLQLWGLTRYDGTYLYQGYEAQEQLSEEYAGYPCICVYDGVGYYENLPEFTHYEKTLLVTEAELADRKETESISSLEKVMVLIKPSVDRQRVFTILEEKYGFTLREEVLSPEREGGDALFLFAGVQKE